MLFLIIIILLLCILTFLVIKGKQQKELKRAQAAATGSSTASSSSSTTSENAFLNREKQVVPLSEKIKLSHDTFLFRFKLPSSSSVLGLPVGQHFKVYAPNVQGSVEGEWNGREDKEASRQEISRAYTPTSSNDDKGHFDLVIKVYKGGVIDRFQDGGKVSQYLDSLKIGDEITIAGPYGTIVYEGRNKFSYCRKPLIKKKVGMVAGGTGLTPMLQIIQAVLKDPEDDTTLSLLYANKSEEDILVRETLEKLQEQHPDRFKLSYTLDKKPNDEWPYYEGFVTKQMLEECMPKPAPDSVILMCGPPPMIDSLKKNLDQLGYVAKRSYLAF